MCTLIDVTHKIFKTYWFSTVYRASLLQLSIIPLVGIAQIGFISRINSSLSPSQYNEALLILNLSFFLNFVDFGILYALYFLLATTKNEETRLKIIANTRKYLIYIFLLNIFLGSFFFLSHKDINVGIYLILFGLNLPGLLNLTYFWALGQDAVYFLIFNGSWPLSFLIINFAYRDSSFNITPKTAFLPLLCSIFINSIYVLHTRKRNLFTKLAMSNDAIRWRILPFSRDFKNTLVFSTISGMLFAVIMQSDKFLAISVKDSSNLPIYLTYGFFSTGIILIMNRSYLSDARGLSLNASGSRKQPIRLIAGFCFGTIFVTTSSMIITLFFNKLSNSPLFLLIGFGIVFLYNTLFQLHAYLFAQNRINLRIPGYLIQGFFTLVTWIYAKHFNSLVVLEFGAFLSLLLNNIYIFIRL